jgi:hypothetical protein
MVESGNLLIQSQPLDDQKLPNFFRLILRSEMSDIEDMDFILQEIDRLGKDIDFN